MYNKGGRGHFLQRHRTVESFRQGLDAAGVPIHRRNSHLFSWDDDFWKHTTKQGPVSLASSASTFEEVESLCLSKSSSDSMGSTQRQWDRYSNAAPWPGSSRRFVSRQSSTTSTSTSRSSGLLGDVSGTDATPDFYAGSRQSITDTLMESMELLGAHGNLDPADRFYLEKIFQRVLNWNNGMPVSAKNSSSAVDRHLRDLKQSHGSPRNHNRPQDANSPQSHAILRDKLERLQRNERSVSNQVSPAQPPATQSSNSERRKRRDLILPEEDDLLHKSNKYHQSSSPKSKKDGMNRDVSNSSRETSSSSKAVSENSTRSRRSYLSSMSSLSIDNGSLRGLPQENPEVDQPTNHPNLAKFFPAVSLKPVGSFESAAPPTDPYIFSQPYTSGHAERVLMGLGFGAAEGFLPERFLKDWYTKISRAQVESHLATVTAEGKEHEISQYLAAGFHNALPRDASTNNSTTELHPRSPAQNWLGNSVSSSVHDASTILPPGNGQESRLERLREYIANYTNDAALTVEEKEMRIKQFARSRQKSLPLFLEALSEEEEGKSRISAVDPFDKEAKLNMFLSDAVSSNGRSSRSNNAHNSKKMSESRVRSSENGNKHSRKHHQSSSKANVTEQQNTTTPTCQSKHKMALITDESEVRSKMVSCRKRPDRRKQRSPTRQPAIDASESLSRDEPTHPSHNSKGNALKQKQTGSSTFQEERLDASDKSKQIPEKNASKDSLEVEDIMQNQISRNRKLSEPNNTSENSIKARPLKSALKQVEPAMVSIVLEDVDDEEGRCTADLLSVSQEGIHLVIPFAACSANSLTPGVQSPITVIEVGLDNQQDSLDTEGTCSSKEMDEDVLLTVDPSVLKQSRLRRRSLCSLSPKTEQTQRRRSTGLISPIPCQLSFTQLQNGSREGQPRRKLSLEVPVVPEIRHLLEKQKVLHVNQSGGASGEQRKSREKRRASFSEEDPIIINEVLARAGSASPRKSSSPFEGSKKLGNRRQSQDLTADKGSHMATVAEENISGATDAIGVVEQFQIFSCDSDQKQVPFNIALFSNTHTGQEVLKSRSDSQTLSETINFPKINIAANSEFTSGGLRSMESSPGSTKSAFSSTSKKTTEQHPSSSNGYYSETDIEEFPVAINRSLKSRPISCMAKTLEMENLGKEGEASIPAKEATPTHNTTSPTLQFSDHQPATNGLGPHFIKKSKIQTISRAVQVVDSSCFVFSEQPTAQISDDSTEYYYACDRGTQCGLLQPDLDTQQFSDIQSFNKFTQTYTAKYEMSSQTMDTSFCTNNNSYHQERTQSRGVNTVLCLTGREHNNGFRIRPSMYNHVSEFQAIDQAIFEIDAELNKINNKIYQRLNNRTMFQVQPWYFGTEPSGRYFRRSKNPEEESGRDFEVSETGKSSFPSRGLLGNGRMPERFAPSTWQDATGLASSSETDRPPVHNRSIGAHENSARLFSQFIETSAPAASSTPTNLSNRFTESRHRNGYPGHGHDAYVHSYNNDLLLISRVKHNDKFTETNVKDFNYNLECNHRTTDTSHREGEDWYTVFPPDELDESVDSFSKQNVKMKAIATSTQQDDRNNIAHVAHSAHDDYKEALKGRITEDLGAYNHSFKNVCDKANPDLVSLPDKVTSPCEVGKPHNAELRLCRSPEINIEITEFLNALKEKEEMDRDHSTLLKRLKDQQSLHNNSHSGLDNELDVLKLGEPHAASTSSNSDAQKKLDHQHETECSTTGYEAQKSGNTVTPKDMMSSVKESTPGLTSAETPGPESQNSSRQDGVEIKNALRLESGAGESNRDTSRADNTPDTNSITNTDNITDQAANKTVSSTEDLDNREPLPIRLSTLKLEHTDSRTSTPEIVISPVKIFQSDFLQVPGSPEHILKRAMYPSWLGSPGSVPSPSPLASPLIPAQKMTISVAGDDDSKKDGPMKTCYFSHDIHDSSIHPGPPKSEDTEDTEDMKESVANSDIPASTVGSLTDFSHLSSVELSVDEFSDASMYPRLSNDSALEETRHEEVNPKSKSDGNDIDLDEVQVGTYEVIGPFPPVFDPDIFKLNHRIQRSQSLGDWHSMGQGHESVDIESNKSVIGSDYAHDIDDAEIDEEESRKMRLSSESSYSEPVIDVTDSFSDDSMSSVNSRKGHGRVHLLTADTDVDEMLQVSDFGELSPSPSKMKPRSFEGNSPSPGFVTRNHPATDAPAFQKSPSRDLQIRSVPCHEVSEDDLDSETELRIRETLRQSRRGSRRASKDNWDVVQSVLSWQRKDNGHHDCPKPEDSSETRNDSQDALVSYSGNRDNINKSEDTNDLVDESSGDECDKEISRINLNRPIIRKLLKMSSDPVDKDVYCSSVNALTLKEKSANLGHNTPLLEETLLETEGECFSNNVGVLIGGTVGECFSNDVDVLIGGTVGECFSNNVGVLIGGTVGECFSNNVDVLIGRTVGECFSNNVGVLIGGTVGECFSNNVGVLIGGTGGEGVSDSVGVSKGEIERECLSDDAGVLKGEQITILVPQSNNSPSGYDLQERLESTNFKPGEYISPGDTSQRRVSESDQDGLPTGTDSMTNSDPNNFNQLSKGDTARILEVEFSDDLDKDTLSLPDRQESLNEPSNDLMDELEMIALFQKIDNSDNGISLFVDYSSESSQDVFQLSQISEEGTQNEDDASDGSRGHIWQVRSRFVVPQDTQDTTLEGNTTTLSVSSSSSEQWNDTYEEIPDAETCQSPRQGSEVVVKATDDDDQHEDVLSEVNSPTKIQETADTDLEVSNTADTHHDHPKENIDTDLQKVAKRQAVNSCAQVVMENRAGDTKSEDSWTKTCGTACYTNDTPHSSIFLNPATDNLKEQLMGMSAQVSPSFETQVVEITTDSAGTVTTTNTSIHTMTVAHLKPTEHAPVPDDGHSRAEEETKHVSTAVFQVRDYRPKNEDERSSHLVPSNQSEAEGEIKTISDSETKRNKIIAAFSAKISRDWSHSLHTNSNFKNMNSESTECVENSHETNIIGENIQDRNSETQESLKDKVRTMFLIDSVNSSDTPEESTHMDTGEIGSYTTRKDLKDITSSLLLIDNISSEEIPKDKTYLGAKVFSSITLQENLEDRMLLKQSTACKGSTDDLEKAACGCESGYIAPKSTTENVREKVVSDTLAPGSTLRESTEVTDAEMCVRNSVAMKGWKPVLCSDEDNMCIFESVDRSNCSDEESADASLSTVRSLGEHASSPDLDVHDTSSFDKSNEGSLSDRSENSQRGLGDDIKSRVRAMFLIDHRSGLSSLDSGCEHPTEAGSAVGENVTQFPGKRSVKVTTMFSRSRDSAVTSFFSSTSVDSGEGPQKMSDQKDEPLRSEVVQNKGARVYDKRRKDGSSGISDTAGKGRRILRFRDSLQRLHEQANVSSLNGSDSDSDLTSALKTHGDFDIRKRDLALGRISSDNCDEADEISFCGENTANASSHQEQEQTTLVSSSSFSFKHDSDTLNSSDTDPQTTDFSNSVSETSNSISVNQAEISVPAENLWSCHTSLFPQVLKQRQIIQEPSQESVPGGSSPMTDQRTSTKTGYRSEDRATLSAANQTVSKSASGIIKNSTSLSRSTGSFSRRLRNNPQSRFLSPNSVPAQVLRPDHGTEPDTYTRIYDDSHPELAYLDVVSRLARQQKTSTTKVTKQHHVEFIITPPETSTANGQADSASGQKLDQI